MIKFLDVIPKKSISWALKQLNLSRSTYYNWRKRYKEIGYLGLVDKQPVPHVHPDQLLQEEVQKILEVGKRLDLDGYRTVVYELEKEGIYISESSAYRYLKKYGLIIPQEAPKREPAGKEWKVKPTKPNEYWHTDITYIWIDGYGFYYLFTYLDGFSRYVIHSELRMSMTVDDTIETLKNALEKVNLEDNHELKLVTDNGAQYRSKRFKKYLEKQHVRHIRTAYKRPETNGKIERWHRTLKEQKISLAGYTSPQDAKKNIYQFVNDYNTIRPHQAIGYVTPEQKYTGKAEELIAIRKRKKAVARRRRRKLNQEVA